MTWRIRCLIVLCLVGPGMFLLGSSLFARPASAHRASSSASPCDVPGSGSVWWPLAKGEQTIGYWYIGISITGLYTSADSTTLVFCHQISGSIVIEKQASAADDGTMISWDRVVCSFPYGGPECSDSQKTTGVGAYRYTGSEERFSGSALQEWVHLTISNLITGESTIGGVQAGILAAPLTLPLPVSGA